jgi:hypothetical protein
MARRRYNDRISKSVGPDGWSAWQWPYHDNYRLACCTCGLVHDVNFKISNRMVGVKFKINRRATAAMRRGKRYAEVAKALKK